MAESREKFLAAVDLGSNSFHMKLARVDSSGQLRTIDRMREMVQLAKGMDAKNRMDEATSDNAIACLERFGQRLQDIAPENVRAVGTNTLRKARDSSKFIRKAEKALGHDIDIISGREEARLVYLGVAHSVQTDDKQRFVMDIGGGSTELIIGRRFKPEQRESLYMGCVSMSEQFFADGSITARNLQAAEVTAQQELESHLATYQDLGWDVVIGASGTIKAVLGLLQKMGWTENTVTQAAMQQLSDYLVEAGSVDRLRELGIDSTRAAVLPGGFAILKATFESLGLDNMLFSDGALREGLLYDMLGRLSKEDVRDQAISDLCARYHVGEKQAKRVAATAEELRLQLEDDWGLKKSYHMKLLNWAARAHEIGLDIAHSQYHRHSAYLMQYSDLAGFSREEQLTLAAMVQSHRRKLRTDAFEQLPEKIAQKALRLTVILRLACLLNRSRRGHKLPDIKLKLASNGGDDGKGSKDDVEEKLRIEFPKDWLAEHPLTAADLSEEAANLKNTSVSLAFK